LILFFIYVGIMALDGALGERRYPSSLRNIFVLIGGLNLPIIHYSVYWWSTLHQGATLSLLGPSHIASAMLWPLLAMIAGFIAFGLMIWCMRLRNLILWDARKSQWLELLLNQKNKKR
jgi:heme exporter protein C